MPEGKTCTRCENYKELDLFPKESKTRPGTHRAMCKACCAKTVARSRAKAQKEKALPQQPVREDRVVYVGKPDNMTTIEYNRRLAAAEAWQ
jgi:hypothetical protein